MNAKLGFVADALTSTILGLRMEREKEVRTLRAFGKLLWLQNDLINRHYQQEVDGSNVPSPDARRGRSAAVGFNTGVSG